MLSHMLLAEMHFQIWLWKIKCESSPWTSLSKAAEKLNKNQLKILMPIKILYQPLSSKSKVTGRKKEHRWRTNFSCLNINHCRNFKLFKSFIQNQGYSGIISSTLLTQSLSEEARKLQMPIYTSLFWIDQGSQTQSTGVSYLLHFTL